MQEALDAIKWDACCQIWTHHRMISNLVMSMLQCTGGGAAGGAGSHQVGHRLPAQLPRGAHQIRGHVWIIRGGGRPDLLLQVSHAL